MKNLITFLFLFLFLIPSVTSLETTQKCLNSTHLETILKWNECDTTCQDYNITQITNCTMPSDSTERCDTTVNQCKYVRQSDMGDIASALILTFSTGMFFFLGIRVQPTKEFSMLKNGMQTLFLIVGLWLLILDIGIANTIAISSGVSEKTLGLVGTGVTTITYSIYVVIVLLMLSYLVSVLWMMLPSRKR